MASIVSVNVGRPRQVVTGRRTVSTAIWKTPVEGRVAVRGVNLAGDDQADRSVHGGADKAVYAYALEEIRALEAELNRDLGAGPVRREPLARRDDGDGDAARRLRRRRQRERSRHAHHRHRAPQSAG